MWGNVSRRRFVRNEMACASSQAGGHLCQPTISPSRNPSSSVAPPLGRTALCLGCVRWLTARRPWRRWRWKCLIRLCLPLKDPERDQQRAASIGAIHRGLRKSPGSVCYGSVLQCSGASQADTPVSRSEKTLVVLAFGWGTQVLLRQILVATTHSGVAMSIKITTVPRRFFAKFSGWITCHLHSQRKAPRTVGAGVS